MTNETENFYELMLTKDVESDVAKEFDKNFVVETFKQFIAQGVPKSDIIRFFHKAQLTGADPRRDQIYLIPRNVNVKKKTPNGWVDNWQKVGTIVFSYHFVTAQAQKTGEVKGVKKKTGMGKYFDPYKNQEIDMLMSECIVNRNGAEFSYIAWFTEYAQDNAQWKSKPHLMLEKCAVAGAFRSAFPEWLSGVNAEEEMGAIENDENTALEAEFERREEIKKEFEAAKAIEERKNSSQKEHMKVIMDEIGKIIDKVTVGFTPIKKMQAVKTLLGVSQFKELEAFSIPELESKLEQLKKDTSDDVRIKNYRDLMLEIPKTESAQKIDTEEKSKIKNVKDHTFILPE